MKYKLNNFEVEFLKSVQKTGSSTECMGINCKDTCDRLFPIAYDYGDCPDYVYLPKELKARATYILNRQDKTN